MNGTTVTVLHEHIHWEGSSITYHHGVGKLDWDGWNDHVSSMETW